MVRRRQIRPIPERDSVADVVRRLYALDVYKTGTSLACKAAQMLEQLSAENRSLKEWLEGFD